MSNADILFKENCIEIMERGFSTENDKVRPVWEDGTLAYTMKSFGIVNRYNLQEEFPMLTQRFINYRAAIDEILGIWQKKLNRISVLTRRMWDSWSGEDEHIKAYGYQLDGLYPCTYTMTFNVSGDTLNAILNQLSQDMLMANGWNVCQYAVLVHLLAQASGLKAGTFIHMIADAYICDRHIPIVKELIERPMYAAPKLMINPKIKNFYNFTLDDIQLEDYQCGEMMRL